jgi:carbon storage regulator CsrA
MLVLSRRKNESIEFPELGITVEVIRVKGNAVRLGIKAPDRVRILRGELSASEQNCDAFLPLPFQLSLAPQASTYFGGSGPSHVGWVE